LMRTWVKICVVFIVALSPSIGVVRNARLHAPVQEGTPTEFWQLACGVNVTGAGEQKVLGGMYPPKGDWAIYYVLGYHDQFLHRVRLSEIAPFMPEVISLLQAEQQQGDLHPVFQRVLESGIDPGNPPADVREFLGLLRKCQLDLAQDTDREWHAYLLGSERVFDERWNRAHSYWLTLAFESLWLGGLIAFASIPWIRNSGRSRWAIHLGLVPTLLFLPYFLGYVPYMFTSAFPAGGVFYPYVLLWFRRLPWTGLDTWLLQFAPQFFEPLTQQPGPMLAVTGMGGVGPVATTVLGVLIGVVILGAGLVQQRIRQLTQGKDPREAGSEKPNHPRVKPAGFMK
jgi:hypothetical protein